MLIRPAQTRDLEAIKRLIARHPKEVMQIHLPAVENFFVAEEDGKIVGCCALDIFSQRMAEVRSLVVARKYQGQGIGSKLINKCLKLAKKKKIIEVLSLTSAVELFKRFGFRTFYNQKVALFKVLRK